jgi:PAS domain S-box-containing protein
LNLDSLSLIRLATVLLSLVTLAYLLSRRPRTAATVFLALVFCGAVVFNVASLLEFSGTCYWQPRTVKNIAVPLLLDVGLSMSAVFLVLFAYFFPRFRSEERREFQVVFAACLLANAARIALAVVDVAVFRLGTSDYRLMEPYYTAWYCTLVVQFLLVTTLLFRKSIRLSGGRSRPVLARLLRPKGRDAKAARAIGLVVLLPLLAAAAALGMTHGILSFEIATDLTWFGLLLFYFAFIVVYLNNTAEPTTIHVKLVGMTLVTVLGILSFVAMLGGKATEADYRGALAGLVGKTVSFVPNSRSSYDVSQTVFVMEPDRGRRLEVPGLGRLRVKLDFDFPFFRGRYRSIHVCNGPMVFLGETVVENGWGGYHPSPAIAPLIMDLDAARGEGVFCRAGPDAAVITWQGLPERGADNRNTVQVVLRRDGSFSLSWAELTPLTPFASAQLYDYTEASMKGGDQAAASAPAPFAPRLTGIHPGGTDAPLDPVSFTGGLPWSGRRPSVIFESWEEGYARYLHGRMSILALLMIASTVLVLFAFPALFRVTLLRPLRALSDGMRRVEEGHLDAAVPAQFHDEIGSLARSFNRMVESINRVETSFRILAEEAEDGILVLHDDVPVFVNRRAVALTGWSPEELRQSGFHAIAGSTRLPLPGMREEQPAETLLSTKTGELLPVELTFSRTQWKGRPADVVLVHDISGRKKAEEENRRQLQLLTQRDKLTTLGVMAAGMAHDIHAPNQVILDYAALLGRAAEQIGPLLASLAQGNPGGMVAGMDAADFRDRFPQMLAAVTGGARRIDSIIRNLQAFSRDSPARDIQGVDLGAVVSSAVELVSGTITRATDRFVVTLAPGLPRTRGNPQRLEQVITNLLLNACQALDGRDKAVTVRTGTVDGGRAVEVEVRDEGIGIRAEDLAKVCDAFFTTRRADGGTGLGLYISQTIVSEHGGTLAVTSAPGKGTAVVVRLPVEERS